MESSYPYTITRICLGCLAFLLLSVAPGPRAQEAMKVIFVDLKVPGPADAGKAYTNVFDRKSVEINVSPDDPISLFEDYSMMEDALDGPECFMPEVKLIFEQHTYIFSLYCTAVVKYSNSAPYTPSSKKVPADIEVTESVLEYLKAARKKYFAVGTDLSLAAKYMKPAHIYNDKVDDLELLKEDDNADEVEMERDAIDKEGWFDDKKDPALEEDNTPEVGDER